MKTMGRYGKTCNVMHLIMKEILSMHRKDMTYA
jgi:hypothetical protein